MQIVLLPSPTGENYNPSRPYRHYIEVCEEIHKLPISTNEAYRLIQLVGNARLEGFCQGNRPNEPF